MDRADDPEPPPPPSLPPSQPSQPTGESEPLLADQLATRHVPPSGPKFDPGLPTARTPRTARPARPARTARSPRITPAAPSAPTAPTEFVRPDLIPMGDSTVALLVGRVLIAMAALVIGIAARRSTGVGGAQRAEAFWPTVWSAAIFTAVGVAGLIFWSTRLADNARRLRTRSAKPRTIILGWLAVVAWVAVSCLTYLRLEIDGDIDPMPGVAALGWLLVLAVAYGQLQGVFRGLSRVPPIVWFSAFPVDLLAIGLVWWRLTSWPSPVGGDADAVRLTANVAFGAAVALTVNVFVFARLAQRGSDGVYERLGRLEARRRDKDGPQPAWFQSGVTERPPNPTVGAATVQRPLIGTSRLSATVAGLHVLWGAGLAVFGLLLAKLAFEYSDVPVFLGNDLALADGDADQVAIVGTVVGIAYVAAIIAHGIWAVLAAINARRITVHSPNPGTFAIAFAPTPLLLVAGLVIGGRWGFWLFVAGLTVAFFALVLVNQMLMALSARLGGDLSGFSRWSLCITLTYLAGIGSNLLFAQAAAQLGLYATLSFIQGALIAAGGVIGFGAMRALEATLRDHRQTPRADPG